MTRTAVHDEGDNEDGTRMEGTGNRYRVDRRWNDDNGAHDEGHSTHPTPMSNCS
jgi:hypothetical protein